MKSPKKHVALLLMSVMLIMLCGCAAKKKTAAPEQPAVEVAYSSPEDLAGKKSVW